LPDRAPEKTGGGPKKKISMKIRASRVPEIKISFNILFINTIYEKVRGF
jgi:hypothetical protein